MISSVNRAENRPNIVAARAEQLRSEAVVVSRIQECMKTGKVLPEIIQHAVNGQRTRSDKHAVLHAATCEIMTNDECVPVELRTEWRSQMHGLLAGASKKRAIEKEALAKVPFVEDQHDWSTADLAYLQAAVPQCIDSVTHKANWDMVADMMMRLLPDGRFTKKNCEAMGRNILKIPVDFSFASAKDPTLIHANTKEALPHAHAWQQLRNSKYPEIVTQLEQVLNKAETKEELSPLQLHIVESLHALVQLKADATVSRSKKHGDLMVRATALLRKFQPKRPDPRPAKGFSHADRRTIRIQQTVFYKGG